jgi:hypothetical protein
MAFSKMLDKIAMSLQSGGVCAAEAISNSLTHFDRAGIIKKNVFAVAPQTFFC